MWWEIETRSFKGASNWIKLTGWDVVCRRGNSRVHLYLFRFSCVLWDAYTCSLKAVYCLRLLCLEILWATLRRDKVTRVNVTDGHFRLQILWEILKYEGCEWIACYRFRWTFMLEFSMSIMSYFVLVVIMITTQINVSKTFKNSRRTNLSLMNC